MAFGRGYAAEIRAVEKSVRTLRKVLALLDRYNLPADIGAYIDFAICRLEEVRKSRSI